jgi:peroxiredoxin
MAARRTHRLIEPGSRAPDFELAALQDGRSTLSELLSGGRLVLAFFKVNCPVCQMAFPFLERIYAAGFRVYGISQNGVDDTLEFNRHFGITFPTLLDAEEKGFPASNDYRISSVPTMYVVEENGAIARVIEGWVRKDMEWLGSEVGINVIRPGERVPDHKPG